ncbi:MAG: hypothetical protein ACI4U5_04960 [Bacilli bacterium]
MKKSIVILLVGLLLCSCGNKQAKDKKSEYEKFITECMERNGTDFFTDGWYEIVRTGYKNNGGYITNTYEYLKGNLSFENSSYIDNFSGCIIRVNELFYQYIEGDYYVYEFKVKNQRCALTTNYPYNTLTTYGQNLDEKIHVRLPNLCFGFNYTYDESGVNYIEDLNDDGKFINEKKYTFDGNTLIAQSSYIMPNIQKTSYTVRTYKDYSLDSIEYSALYHECSSDYNAHFYISMKKSDSISIEVPDYFEYDIDFLKEKNSNFSDKKNIDLSF